MKSLLESLESDWGMFLGPGETASAIRKLGRNQQKIARQVDLLRKALPSTNMLRSTELDELFFIEPPAPEKTLLEAAKDMVQRGMVDAGYDSEVNNALLELKWAVEREEAKNG